MKIDVGESLIYSWLKHTKNCQSVQLHWKPLTSSRNLYNDYLLEKVMTDSFNFFMEKYEFQIFNKTNSLDQFLQTGEIVALGLEINEMYVTNIYGIDMDFYEDNQKDTIENIITKLVRTAMYLIGYFNTKKGYIIYASPKITSAVASTLVSCTEDLKNLFNDIGCEFEFQLYCNNNFKHAIYNPVINLSTVNTDSSELFLKSIQMKNSFQEHQNTQKKHKIEDEQNANYRNFEIASNEIKIGKIVRNTLEQLASTNSIHPVMVERLMDGKYCKEKFDINYPVLKPVKTNESYSEQVKINGYNRYWTKSRFTLIINGIEYFVCNDWYEKSRMKFLVWAETLY